MEDNDLPVEKIKFLLMVQDMDRALAFYQDVFGLQADTRSEHWSEMSFGEAVLALHGGGGDEERNTGLSFQVRDLESTCQQVVEVGGSVISEPASRPGEPIKLARLRDTEGNQFAVTQFVGRE